MGESFGAWALGDDFALMDYVSSVNVACGFHAGDASTIRETVETAINKGCKSRRTPVVSRSARFRQTRNEFVFGGSLPTLFYIKSPHLKSICETFGGTTQSRQTARRTLQQGGEKRLKTAAAIAEAVVKIDKNLIFYGLSGSFLITEAEKLGLRTASEVFADRTYQTDGTLTPRTFAERFNYRRKTINRTGFTDDFRAKSNRDQRRKPPAQSRNRLHSRRRRECPAICQTYQRPN